MRYSVTPGVRGHGHCGVADMGLATADGAALATSRLFAAM